MDRKLESLSNQMLVHTPVGNVVIINQVYRECEVEIDTVLMTRDLLPLKLEEFDAILGKNFLSKYHATMDWFRKEVVFKKQGEAEVIFRGRRKILPTCLIFAVKARRMLSKGCEAFLAHVVEAKPSKLKPKDVPVVCEYLDAFPEELSRLPLDREVEFIIDLILGTTLISQAPYRMAPEKLKELKVQLQELVNKGYIRPSVSSRAALVLFVNDAHFEC